jgi:hypothetical protein
VAEEFQRLGWREQELVTRRKSDPTKLALAMRLRKETTLSLKRIAARVHLGTSKSANAKLHCWLAGSLSAPKPGLSSQLGKMTQTM